MEDNIFREALSMPLHERREFVRRVKQSIIDEEQAILARQKYEVVKSAVETVMERKLDIKSRLRIDVRGKVFMSYILRNDGYSLTEIGNMMGLNHSSVYHLSKTMEDWLSVPTLYKEEIEQFNKIEKLIYEG